MMIMQHIQQVERLVDCIISSVVSLDGKQRYHLLQMV